MAGQIPNDSFAGSLSDPNIDPFEIPEIEPEPTPAGQARPSIKPVPGPINPDKKLPPENMYSRWRNATLNALGANDPVLNTPFPNPAYQPWLAKGLDAVAQWTNPESPRYGMTGKLLGMVGGAMPGTVASEVPLKSIPTWGGAMMAMRGGMEEGPFREAMLKDFGPGIEPQLGDIFQKSKGIYEAHIARASLDELGEHHLPNLKTIVDQYNKGIEGQDWYLKTRPELERQFGPDSDLFINMLAATSPNATVPANMSLALKAYKAYKNGLSDFRAFSDNPAHPGFMKPVIDNLNHVIRNEPISGQKIINFAKNLRGETEPVTVDRWMMRALGMPKAPLGPNTYKFADYWLSQVAHDMGVEPRQLQAAVWKTAREVGGQSAATGQPFEAMLAKRLAKDPDLAGLLNRVRQAAPPPGMAHGGAVRMQHGGSLQEQAAQQYPGIADAIRSSAFRVSQQQPGDLRGLEFYSPGEQESFDPSRPAIEVFDPKARPMDVAGDLVSHYLARGGAGGDSILTKGYDDFAQSMTPEQHHRLQEQYQYSQQHEGERRPYNEWYRMSGLPAYFRGYLFHQWDQPREGEGPFNVHDWYTPEQLQSFAKLDQYMKTARKRSGGAIDGGWYGENSPSPVRMADGGWNDTEGTTGAQRLFGQRFGSFLNAIGQGAIEPITGSLQLANRAVGVPDKQTSNAVRTAQGLLSLDPVMGGLQAISRAIPGAPTQTPVDEQLRQVRENYKRTLPGGQEDWFHKIPRWISSGLVEGAAIPEVKIAEGLGRVGSKIASGAAEGALYGLPVAKETPNTFGETGISAAGGALFGIGERYLAPPAERGIAAFINKMGASPETASKIGQQATWRASDAIPDPSDPILARMHEQPHISIPPGVEHEAEAQTATAAAQEANPAAHAIARNLIKRFGDIFDPTNYGGKLSQQSQPWTPPSPPTPPTPDRQTQQNYDPLYDPLYTSGEPYARGGLYGQMRRASLRTLHPATR